MTSSAARKRGYGPALILAAAAALYLLCRHAYYVGFFNDDAFYIIGARSLLHGRYAELNAPGAPPLINYLPGFSVLLAPVAALAGGALWPYQLAAIALMLAALACFVPLAQALCPDAPLAALALAAFTPLAVSMSGTVLSDVPMLAAVLAALVWARRVWDERRLARWLPIALLCGFAALLRPTGAALALAFTLALAFELRAREALLFYLCACLFAVPFLFRNRVLSGHGLMYFMELSRPYQGVGRWEALRVNFVSNLAYYLKLVYSSMLFRAPGEPGPAVALAVGVGAVATGYGLRDAGWKGWRKLPALFLLVFCGVHLMWSKQAGRYALPVLPLLFAYFLRGVSLVGGRSKAGRRRPALAAAGVALALMAAVDARVVAASWTRRSPVTRPPESTLSWIRARTPQDAVFAAELDGRLYLLSGRRCVHLQKLFKPSEFAGWLSSAGVSYVAVFPNDFALTTSRGDAFNDPMPEDSLRSLLADSSRYQLAFADDAEGSQVYRVVGGPSAQASTR